MRRPMRLRSSPALRNLVAETSLSLSQLIQPLFAVEGISSPELILGLKGTRRDTLESLLGQVEQDLKAGVSQFILFPVPQNKAEKNFSHDFATQVISQIKK